MELRRRISAFTGINRFLRLVGLLSECNCPFSSNYSVTVLIGLGLTRRLALLSSAAAQVEAGNYSVTIPTDINDEISKTATAFNRMVTEVDNRTQQLKKAEAQSSKLLRENRQLIHTSLEVQEQERKYLARELHDEMGQCLTAIQADAELIRDNSQDNSRIQISADAIMKVSSRVYDVMHSMMHRLRPSILDNLDERTSINLYRILQECLTNISKHAAATQVHIELSSTDKNILLKVSDNGSGFDADSPSRGLGLIGMRERVSSLGGEMVLKTASGKGLIISISVPYHELRIAN